MSAPLPLPAEELLARGVNTARLLVDLGEARLARYLTTEADHPTTAKVAALAMVELARPGRIGSLDDVRDALAVALFDNAHEHCDDESGCTGGGLPYWREFVDGVLMPAIREYAIPSAVGGERSDNPSGSDLGGVA